MSRRRTSVGSIFWGLTLVGIGGLLLARNLGFTIPIWGPLAKYWPVLIIMWGLLKLVDYFRMRNDEQKRPLFSGGEVAMLVLVIFAGSAITAAANISPDIGAIFDFDGNFDFWDITGNNYQFTEHHELDAKADSTINIFNLYGYVDVKPADGDRIVLDVEKTVRAANKEEADRRSQEFTFSIRDEGGSYRIASSRDDNAPNQIGIRIGNERQRFKSNMTLRVPRKSLLNLTNRYGSINVDGLEGNQTITNKYGATTIQNITGAVNLTTGYSSAVVENISGDAVVSNAYASTTVRSIGGKVTIDNKYGHLDMQDVKGDATVENRYSAINVERVTGNLVATGRNNSIDIDDVGGTVEAETSYKNLSVRNAKGRMTLTNRHGSINVDMDESPGNDITVNGQYSDVTIELPANASFQLEGRATYGNVDSEFDSLSNNSSGREHTLRGQQGAGGPHINVVTQHGSIRLDKRG